MIAATMIPLEIVLVVLYFSNPVSATFYPRQPFIDPACQRSKNCSWQFSSPNGNMVQPCSIKDYLDNGALDGYCPNPVGVPTDVDERAAPVNKDDIIMEEFSKYFDETKTGDPDTAGDYTCLRIKYKISEFVASKLKGIQFTVRGMNSDDLNLYLCQNHIYGDDATHYYAVRDFDGQDYIPREFTFECFCGIKPGYRYIFVIRTLPVDYGEDKDLHDTAEVLEYPRDCTNPSSCDNKQSDKRCEWSIEAQWYPRCQTSQQILSGNYDTVQVSFDRAPAQLNFDRYKVLLYYFDRDKNKVGSYTGQGALLEMGSHNQEMYTVQNGSCYKESNYILTTNLNLPKVHRSDNAVLGCYVSVVQAFPTERSCRTAEGNEIPGGCPAKRSLPFCIIANPCDSSPCGINGVCQPDGDDYRCSCNDGYMEVNKTCVVDPCAGNPCNSSAGSCDVHQTNGVFDYTCNCNEGFTPQKDGKTCVVDPCYTDPCQHGSCWLESHHLQSPWDYICTCNDGYEFVGKTCKVNPCFVNVTKADPCGEYGQCMEIINHNSIDYNCTCDNGYREGFSAEKQKTCIPINSTLNLILAITLGSFVAVVLIIIMIALLLIKNSDNPKWKDLQYKLSICPKDGDSGEKGHPFTVSPPNIIMEEPVPESNPKVFILYSEDHELHTDCILRLATFLMNIFKCKVRLDMWNKMEIGDKKCYLYNEITNADKVLMIFSKGTSQKLQAAIKQKPTDDGTVGEFGDMFMPGYKFASSEFEKDPTLLSSKYVAAYFEYSQKEDVLPEMREVAKFEIPKRLEQLYFKLHDISQHSPQSSRRIKNLQCSEGIELHTAIEKMKNFIRLNPKWYEKACKQTDSEVYPSYPPGSHPNSLGNEDIDPDFFHASNDNVRASSADGDNQSVAFTDCFCEISQSQAITRNDSGYHGETDYDLRHGNPGLNNSIGPTFNSDNSHSYEAEFDVALGIPNCNCNPEQNPFQNLVTLDPNDVELHQPPSGQLNRMDSGYDYMSDIQLNSNPQNVGGTAV